MLVSTLRAVTTNGRQDQDDCAEIWIGHTEAWLQELCRCKPPRSKRADSPSAPCLSHLSAPRPSQRPPDVATGRRAGERPVRSEGADDPASAHPKFDPEAWSRSSPVGLCGRGRIGDAEKIEVRDGRSPEKRHACARQHIGDDEPSMNLVHISLFTVRLARIEIFPVPNATDPDSNATGKREAACGQEDVGQYLTHIAGLLGGIARRGPRSAGWN